MGRRCTEREPLRPLSQPRAFGLCGQKHVGDGWPRPSGAGRRRTRMPFPNCGSGRRCLSSPLRGRRSRGTECATEEQVSLLGLTTGDLVLAIERAAGLDGAAHQQQSGVEHGVRGLLVRVLEERDVDQAGVVLRRAEDDAFPVRDRRRRSRRAPAAKRDGLSVPPEEPGTGRDLPRGDLGQPPDGLVEVRTVGVVLDRDPCCLEGV